MQDVEVGESDKEMLRKETLGIDAMAEVLRMSESTALIASTSNFTPETRTFAQLSPLINSHD